MTISHKNTLLIIMMLFSWNIISSQNGNNIFDDELSLQDCIEYALKNNPVKFVNKHSIKISEAQLNQANSAYWPQLNLNASAITMDEAPNFIFPSSSFELSGLAIPGLELGPIEIPLQDIKLMDKTLFMGSLELVYPIYTGGYISSLVGQAKGGLLLAKEEARKNELQIVTDVKKRFYGISVLKKLAEIGEETLARLETTLELTENLYLKGSGTVSKTDFLKNKILVENVRSINSSFKHNLILAKSALLNVLGEKDVNQNIKVNSDDILVQSHKYIFEELLGKALQNNPTWKTLQIAQNIFENKVDEAFSGHLPRVGLIGSANALANDYSYGMVSDVNKFSWTVGIGLEMPLFNGFRTSAKVDEANHRLEKIKSQKILLENGLQIMVKKAMVDFESATEQNQALKSAMDTAIENRSLNERAYQSDLVELQDLLEAQIYEAIMEAQYYKSLYTYFESLAELEFIIGTELK